MTTLEKITTLNWFDFLRKIKDILLNLNSQAIEDAPEDGTQYARQDGEWTEIIGGGGGSQDLQSVLTEGNIADKDIVLTSIYGTQNIILSPDNSTIEISKDSQNYYVGLGLGTLPTLGFITNGIIQNVSPNILSTGQNIYYLPVGTGTEAYTLATLDDIQAPLPTYADNASAITGGLVADNWYKTATGELRVVV